MSRATKTTALVAAAPAQADGAPIVGEAAAIRLVMQSLALVTHEFESLNEARKNGSTLGEPFDERKDADVDTALDLVAREIERMQSEPVALEDAERRWWQCEAAVCLARNAYSKGEATYYGRLLHRMARQFDVLPDLWAFAG